MVRTPCCDKNGLKKGTWSPEEDKKLIAYVTRYGCWNWRQLPKFAGLQRCGKSCRLRWMNYLRPNIKRGNYTEKEEEIIIRMHKSLGNRWSAIAAKLPGRTDNEIKNYWHTYLKKRGVQESTTTTHEQETISNDLISQHETTQTEQLEANLTDSLNQAGTLLSFEMLPTSPQPSTSDFSSATSDTMATASMETETVEFDTKVSQLNLAISVSSMNDMFYDDSFALLEAYEAPKSEDFRPDLFLGDSFYVTNEVWEPLVDFDIPILEGELLFS